MTAPAGIELDWESSPHPFREFVEVLILPCLGPTVVELATGPVVALEEWTNIKHAAAAAIEIGFVVTGELLHATAEIEQSEMAGRTCRPLDPANGSPPLWSMSMADPAAADPYVNGLPDDVQQQLARRYADVFRVFLKHSDAVTRVTFWGLSDADSSLNRGRMNYPLLWDRQRQPKPAFNAVVDVLRSAK